MAYPHIGPIETLKDAWRARRDLWVLCRGCGHARRVKPGHLVVDYGDMSLHKLQGKFRCRKCLQNRAAIVVHDEARPGR